MDLANEDALRLNVLLKTVNAVRIDEQDMVVYGLSDRGEAKVALNPNCRPERYLKLVREFLSGAALGSPGGYPVYLKRWTRMGDIKATLLAELLMLGEPEAVTAVVSATGLTEELARRAWWASPDAETARALLRRDCVIESTLGTELAGFLVEHLPFETNPYTILDTVRLILQQDLVDADTRRRIWDKGNHKNAYRIGFLAATPHDLPETLPSRGDLEEHRQILESLADSGNRLATFLLQLLDSTGQTFLHTAEQVLRRPADQDVVVVLLNTLAEYFQPALVIEEKSRDIHTVINEAQALVEAGEHPGLEQLTDAVPALKPEIVAMLSLSRADDEIVTPIFSQTDAIGTVMRRRLEPVTTPLFEQFAVLRGTRS
jgi:hypothetical protein